MNAPEAPRQHRGWPRYRKGLRTAIQTNASAYAFSVYITTSFAALHAMASAGVRDALLYALGNALAFAIIEAVSTRGFRVRLHGEGTDVVTLGGAISGVAIAAGFAASWALALLLAGWLRWLLCAFVGASVFLAMLALAMDVARRVVERQPHEEEQEPSPQDRERT